jgi:molybdopterin synthase catalytic subunit
MSNGFLALPAHACFTLARRGVQAVKEESWTGMRQILTHQPVIHALQPWWQNRPMSSSRVLITTQDFNLADEVAALRADDKRVGAVCTFTGTVRDRNLRPQPGSGLEDKDTVLSMELEHYPGMTEKAIEAMIDEAMQRFDIFGARVIHRVGLLQPLDQVVMVAVTSAHRGESFKACEFLMDYLKTQAPFWKKEETPEGARWVDARVSDDAALARWGISAPNA